MNKLKLFPPLFLLLFLFSSCLQHHFKITVNEDGSVDYQYTASGDSADLYDELISLPQGLPWEIEEYTEIDTSDSEPDTVYYYRARAYFAPGEPLPAAFGGETVDYASVDLQHPLKIRRQDLFFMVNYCFNFRFPSRRSEELYGTPEDYISPERRTLDEADSLDDAEIAELDAEAEKGYRIWLAVIVSDFFIKSLRQYMTENPRTPIDTLKFAQVREELEEFFKIHFIDIDSDSEFDDALAWNSIFPKGFAILKENLGLPAGEVLYDELMSIGQAFERECRVTEDLDDESFSVELYLPGELRSSNADSVGEFLAWEFNGADIADSTIVLSAIATIYHQERLYIAGGILIIVIVLLVKAMLKPKKI